MDERGNHDSAMGIEESPSDFVARGLSFSVSVQGEKRGREAVSWSDHGTTMVVCYCWRSMMG